MVKWSVESVSSLMFPAPVKHIKTESVKENQTSSAVLGELNSFHLKSGIAINNAHTLLNNA